MGNTAYRDWVIEQLKTEGVPEEEWWVTRGNQKLLRMPKRSIEKKLITFQPTGEQMVIISRYAVETEEGYWAYWDKYRLSDLPNDFISLDDLKRLGVNPVNPESLGGE